MGCCCCCLLGVALAPLLALALWTALVRWRRKGRKGQRGGEGGLNVIFLHPDLGIGGAERLVVDIGVQLRGKGHKVEFITAHHNDTHCFAETDSRQPGSLEVSVWHSVPATVLGVGRVLLVHIQMAFIAMKACLLRPNCDVFIVDQDAIPCPILWLAGAPCLFYCHFPDKLCDPTLAKGGSRSPLRSLYRFIFDGTECQSLKFATSMVFNSKFTRETTFATFPSLGRLIDRRREGLGKTVEDSIVYPTCPSPDDAQASALALRQDDEYAAALAKLREADTLGVLSINRFECKKNVILLVKAFALLRKDPSRPPGNPHLFLVGGYDGRLEDNKRCMSGITDLLDSDPGLKESVHIMTSASTEAKFNALKHCSVLAYTPEMEHFGIVPLEAMAMGRPVVVVENAGPKETILHEQTGYLVPLSEYTPEGFAQGIAWCLEKQRAQPACFERPGRERVQLHFSTNSLGNNVERALYELVPRGRR